jgi:multiple sugar transport system substrate-binding protein
MNHLNFSLFITSEKAVQRLYAEATNKRLFGPPYARVSLGEPLKADPLVGAFISQAGYARSFPLASSTHDGGLNKNMIKYMEDAMNSYIQGQTPQSALDKMTQGFNQVLSNYGLVSAR